MKALLACEESQIVCIEFRKIGVEAYSCDIEECSGGGVGIAKAMADRWCEIKI